MDGLVWRWRLRAIFPRALPRGKEQAIRSNNTQSARLIEMPRPTRPNVSAGLLLFRRSAGRLEVFIAHPGGPFWRDRDAGAWTIPKGIVEAGEDLLDAAQREFLEETSIKPVGPFIPLGSI